MCVLGPDDAARKRGRFYFLILFTCLTVWGMVLFNPNSEDAWGPKKSLNFSEIWIWEVTAMVVGGDRLWEQHAESGACVPGFISPQSLLTPFAAPAGHPQKGNAPHGFALFRMDFCCCFVGERMLQVILEILRQCSSQTVGSVWEETLGFRCLYSLWGYSCPLTPGSHWCMAHASLPSFGLIWTHDFKMVERPDSVHSSASIWSVCDALPAGELILLWFSSRFMKNSTTMRSRAPCPFSMVQQPWLMM